MTQFEQNLENLKNSLDTQQAQHFNERWINIKSTVIAPFRTEKERECNEAIAMLQQKRDAAIAEKEAAMKAELQAEVDYVFGQARQKLEEAQALFSSKV